MHLRYNYFNAYDNGEDRHAQEVFKELGITYQFSTPQSLGDQYWFWNCDNIPDKLPPYITILDIDNPLEYVGWGLSKEEAMKIKYVQDSLSLSEKNFNKHSK